MLQRNIFHQPQKCVAYHSICVSMHNCKPSKSHEKLVKKIVQKNHRIQWGFLNGKLA